MAENITEGGGREQEPTFHMDNQAATTGGFTEMMASFEPEEKSDAEFYADIYTRYVKLGNEDYFSFLNKMLKNYFFKLDIDRQKIFRGTKLFHLFYDCSLSIDDWKKLPLNTFDREFEQFIDETFLPKLEEFEQIEKSGDEQQKIGLYSNSCNYFLKYL